MTARGDNCPESSTELRERIRDLPRSAKLVALVLEYNGTLTKRELAAETLLQKRTVRLGLEKLQQADVIESRTSLQDARKRLYSLSLGSAAESN